MIARTQSAPRLARVVRWNNLFLFSANLGWMTIWCEGSSVWGRWVHWPPPHWPARLLIWNFWMPEPPVVLFQVAYSLALTIPVFLALLLLARVGQFRLLLHIFAGAFAIVGYPFFALQFNDLFFSSPSISGHEISLFLETVAVLAGGVLYYLRSRLLPPVAGALIILAHFSLWAWVTRSYGNPFGLIGAYHPGFIVPAPGVALGICISLLFHYGFPVIGFLSAFTSGLSLRLLAQPGPGGVDTLNGCKSERLDIPV